MKPTDRALFDPKAFLAKAGTGRVIARYRRNRTVFLQGAAADSLFYILKGKVKLTVTSKQGKQAVVAILGVGDFLGEGCLAGQELRMAGATTMSECSILKLERAAVVRVLHEEPAFSEMFVHHLLSRNIRIQEDLVDQLFNSSEKRLARVLLLLANFGKESKPEPVIPKISQETLAEIVGTIRPRSYARLHWTPPSCSSAGCAIMRHEPSLMAPVASPRWTDATVGVVQLTWIPPASQRMTRMRTTRPSAPPSPPVP